MSTDSPDFRFYGKNVLLTFSQTGQHTEEDLSSHVQSVLSAKAWRPHTFTYVEEKHSDGGHHTHIGLNFSTPVDIRDSRLFDMDCQEECCEDLVPLHANITPFKGKNANRKVWTYVQKSGNAKGDDERSTDYIGYGKIKSDKRLWLSDARRKNIQPVSPFTLPDGTKITWDFKTPQRLSIIIIHGKNGSGKTTWVEKTSSFTDTNTFFPNHPTYPMEGYAGQPVIIYDDFRFPETKDPCKLLIENTQFSRFTKLVGATRYTPIEYNKSQQNLVIILCREHYQWMKDGHFSTRVLKIVDLDKLTPSL